MSDHLTSDPMWDEAGHATVDALLAHLDLEALPLDLTAHVETCGRCTTLLEDLTGTVSLVVDVGAAPPGVLEAATDAALAAMASDPVPALVVPPPVSLERHRRAKLATRFLAAAAAVTVVGVGVGSVLSSHRTSGGSDGPLRAGVARSSTIPFDAAAVATSPASPSATNPAAETPSAASNDQVGVGGAVGAPSPLVESAPEPGSATESAPPSAPPLTAASNTRAPAQVPAQAAAPEPAPPTAASGSAAPPTVAAAAPRAAKAAASPAAGGASPANPPAAAVVPAAPLPASAGATTAPVPTSVASAAPAATQDASTLPDLGTFTDLAALVTQVSGSAQLGLLPVEHPCAPSLRLALATAEVRVAMVHLGQRTAIVGFDDRPGIALRAALADPQSCTVGPQDITPIPGTTVPPSR